jgi:replicative DNA helicase
MDTQSSQNPVMFDMQAERGVIGSIVMEPFALVPVSGLIGWMDFYNDYCASAYRAALELYQDNQPIDLITIGSWLKANSKLQPEDTTWNQYLYEMVDELDKSEGYSDHAITYANTIKLYSLCRKLEAFGRSTSLKATKIPDGKALLEELNGEFHSIVQWWEKGRSDDICMTKEQSLDFIQTIAESVGPAEVFTGEELPRLGFPTFDGDADRNLLPRLIPLPGTVTAIIADTGLGKTSLLDQISQANEVAGLDVAIYHPELKNEFLTMRRVTRLSEVPFINQIMGRLSHDQRANIVQAKEQIASWPGRMDSFFCPGYTIEQIAADFKLRQQALEIATGKRYRVLILDYLQKVAWSSRHLAGDNQATQFDHIISRFADLSNEMGVAGILAIQPKRDNKTPQDEFIKPTLHGGLGTSAIEQRCNQVLGIWRDKKPGEPVSSATLTALKSTFGESDWSTEMYFYTSRFQFEE